MKLCCKKLNSSHGASILMGLLVVLVVTMVSVVILSAATANSGRIRRNQAEEQAYLTVSSAARLMRDTIVNGSGYEYDKDCEEEVTEYDEDGVPHTHREPHPDVEIAEGMPFSQLLNGLAKTANSSKGSQTFTLTAPDMEPVKVVTTMYAASEKVGNSTVPQYGFKAVLCLADDNATQNSYVTLVCIPSVSVNISLGGNLYGTAIKWTSGSIVKGAQ